MLAGAFVLAALVTPAALVSPGASLARGSVVTARRSPRAAASSTDDDPRAVESSKPIPLTILSGFLGVGKTTVLSHLLSNKEGARIGVIVDDVAAVNIDAKLVATGGSDARDGGSGLGLLLRLGVAGGLAVAFFLLGGDRGRGSSVNLLPLGSRLAVRRFLVRG